MAGRRTTCSTSRPVHNSIGRFYETFGNGGADTRERTLGAQRHKPRLVSTQSAVPAREVVDAQQRQHATVGDSVRDELCRQRQDRFLNNFYLKSKRSIAKATNEGPAAYVIPGDTPRPVEAADMVNLMRLHGIEVQTHRQGVQR